MTERIPVFEKPSGHIEALMSTASQIRDDERIPRGYSLFRREVRLLNGKTEPAFYSTHENQTPDPQAWERSSSSLVEGFTWALTVPEFADHETEDDDRTQEIGNMISYAMSQGLTEDQVLECYEKAFAAATHQSK
jgi:hypothetical protein